jgi:C-terminal processing protease CtpA/Prc
MRAYKALLALLAVIITGMTISGIGEDTGTATPTAPVDTSYTAPVINEQGGPVRVRGVLPITNVNVKQSSMRPLIILEDQTNFVTRDVLAPIPQLSQVIAHFTTDFYADEPVGYELILPAVPQGVFNDVDNNGSDDPGVQIYQVGYWEDRFGAIYLDGMDAYGWSSAYSSARVDDDPRLLGEIIGGKLLVYAAVPGQGFSAGFGEDGKLLTADDPVVTMPVGYTLVDLDTDPFTFDRSREVVIDLIEPESLVLDDFSDLSYSEAFDALINKAKKEYAFTELKNMDWDALYAEFRPRFERAEQQRDQQAYFDALDQLVLSIPDGHVAARGNRAIVDGRRNRIQGSIGVNLRELSDGRVLVNVVSPGSPAERAGIQVGAEVIAINNTPIDRWISSVVPFFGPYSNAEQLRLGQVLFAARFPLGETVTLQYRNPGSRETTTTLNTIQEFDALQIGQEIQDGTYGDSPYENPVEFRFTPEGIGIVEVNTFSGYENLIVENWTYFINLANQIDAPAVIVDLRSNAGGFSSIANRLAAMFYTENIDLYNTENYAKALDNFYTDPRFPARIEIDPNAPYYGGELVVLVGPSCASACEFFAYALTRNERATVIGQYGTYAIGGGWSPTYMPENVEFALPTNRKIDAAGTIIIEGSGIQPDIRVAVDETNFASTEDVILAAALEYLSGR